MNYRKKNGNEKTVRRLFVVALGILCLVPSSAINITARLNQEAGIAPILIAIGSVVLAAGALIGTEIALKNRQYRAAIMMVLMFIPLFSYNIINAVGVSSATRDSYTAPRRTAMETVTRLKNELSSLSAERQELSEIAGKKTPEMINAEIRGYQLKNQRIWNRTNHCGSGRRDVTRDDSGSFCANLAKMKARSEAAAKIRIIDSEIKTAKEGLKAVKVHNSVDDPFIEGVFGVLAVFLELEDGDKKKISVGYDLMFGLAAEVMSNFGPWFMVFMLWPAAPVTPRNPKIARKKVVVVDVASQIEQFMDESVITKPGSNIQAGVLYKGYKGWCEANGLEAANQTAFGKKLNVTGYEKNKIRSNVFYLNVQLKEALRAVA